MKLILLSGGENVPWTNARRELITKLMGVDMFPTGNQVVKPTPLETSGTQNNWYTIWNRWVTWTREQSFHNADNSTKARKQSVYDLRSSARENSS